jgi:cytochrome P450
MRFLASVKQRLATRLLERTMSNGLDLRKLRFFPESIQLPFKRDGLDPVPELTRMRETEGVTRLTQLFGRDIWLVTGYDEARSVLAAGEDFSNDLAQFVPQEGRDAKDQVGGLGMTDPPGHTAMRRLLTPEFTKKRLARLEPLIEGIVADRLDALAAAGPTVDLVQDFAFPVPFEVICELLGLPVDDRAKFHSLGVARFDLSTGSAGSFDAAGHSRDFLISSVAKQRANPGPGLIGALLTDHGDELDDTVLGGLVDGVFLGGYETSASMLALGAYLLADNPEAMELVRTGDDETVDRVIAEMLRYLTVVQLAFVRFARRDLELGGRQIHAGDIIGVSLLTANRDPELGPHLESFDPHREPTRHLAFGHGLHRCVGSELARMELRIALRQLTRRFPDLHVVADMSELEFRKLSAVYGVESLPVDLHAREPQSA